MQRFSIHDEKKLKNFLKEKGEKPFRYEQIENSLYKNFIQNFNSMNLLTKKLRDDLEERFYFYSIKLKQRKDSKNGQTSKFLFETKSGDLIESVIMRHLSGRISLCVSCQSGCPMACSFCATGKIGLKKNLEFYEIVEQIYFCSRVLFLEGKKLRNIVYMGMGEPMLNYDAVKQSIDIANSQKKFDLSNRRITISTCGIIPGIEKMTRDFPQTSLAISLHAPLNEIRNKIMPVNYTYPLEDLISSLDKYTKKTNKKVFYEYVMINGINDNIKLAHELGKLLEGKLAHVNFIPYNPGNFSGEIYSSSPRFLIEKFQSILSHYGVVSTIRVTMGDDINAACGQLASK